MLRRDGKSGLDSPNSSQQFKYKKVMMQNQPRKNQLNFRSSKVAEYRSIDRDKNAKPGQIYNASQKSSSYSQSQEQQGVRNAVRHEYGKQERAGNVQSRSKSKEKKDRLTLNLAKFSKKRQQDKSKSMSRDSKMQKEQKQKPIESIYLDRQQTAPKEQIHPATYQPQRSSQSPYHLQVQQNRKIQSKSRQIKPQAQPQTAGKSSIFSQDFQSFIDGEEEVKKEEVRMHVQNNNIRTLSGQKYERQRSQEQKISKEKQYISASKPVQNISDSSVSKPVEASQKRMSEMLPSSSSIDLIRAQKQHTMAIEQLNKKMQRDKQDYNQKLRKYTVEKQQLQQNNKQLVQAQIKLKHEMTLSTMKNNQLIKDIDMYKNIIEGNRQNGLRDAEDNLQEKEFQIRKLGEELTSKNGENHQLKIRIMQLESQCKKYQNQANAIEHLKNNQMKELDIQRKKYDVKLQQAKNNFQRRLKQMQAVDTRFEEERLRGIIKDRQREIEVINGELNSQQQKIRKMMSERESTEKQQLQSKLQAKYVQTENLIKELNFNHEKLRNMSAQSNQQVREYQAELRRRDGIINQLNDQIAHLKRNRGNQGKEKRAFQQLYRNYDNVDQDEDKNRQAEHFVKLQQSQSRQFNALRQQISAKSKEINSISMQNQDLKTKIRRLQQQNQISTRTVTTNVSNLKQAKQASETVFKGEIQSLKRKMNSLQLRMNLKDRQIRDKNRFIKQNLTGGITNRPDASVLLHKLEQLLTQNQE